MVGRNFMNHNCSAVLAVHPLELLELLQPPGDGARLAAVKGVPQARNGLDDP